MASAIGMRRMIMEDNIYTMKLARRGQHVPKERHSHMFAIRKVDDLMLPVVGRLKLSDLGAGIIRTSGTGTWVVGDRYAVVEDDKGRLLGVVPVDGAGAPVAGAPLIDSYTVIRKGDFVQGLMKRMARRKATVVLVLNERGVPRPDKIAGVINRKGLADAIINEYAE